MCVCVIVVCSAKNRLHHFDDTATNAGTSMHTLYSVHECIRFQYCSSTLCIYSQYLHTATTTAKALAISLLSRWWLLFLCFPVSTMFQCCIVDWYATFFLPIQSLYFLLSLNSSRGSFHAIFCVRFHSVSFSRLFSHSTICNTHTIFIPCIHCVWYVNRNGNVKLEFISPSKTKLLFHPTLPPYINRKKTMHFTASDICLKS